MLFAVDMLSFGDHETFKRPSATRRRLSPRRQYGRAFPEARASCLWKQGQPKRTQILRRVEKTEIAVMLRIPDVSASNPCPCAEFI
jgi:hypothetical protein